MTEKESLHSTHEWLRAVAKELGVDPQLVRELVGDVLDLTAAVAHNGPSRPAAPTTAFLIGLAAGADASADDIRALMARTTALLDSYESAAQ